MAIRCIIIGVKKNYYIAKDWNGNRYKIIKNEYLNNKHKGDDFYFYAKKEKKLFRTILIPISEEEAFNIDQ